MKDGVAGDNVSVIDCVRVGKNVTDADNSCERLRVELELTIRLENEKDVESVGIRDLVAVGLGVDDSGCRVGENVIVLVESPSEIVAVLFRRILNDEENVISEDIVVVTLCVCVSVMEFAVRDCSLVSVALSVTALLEVLVRSRDHVCAVSERVRPSPEVDSERVLVGGSKVVEPTHESVKVVVTVDVFVAVVFRPEITDTVSVREETVKSSNVGE